MITEKEAREYLDTIKKHFKHRLTEWENDFVLNCSGQQGHLSDKQKTRIDKVMEKCATTYQGSDRG